jgi:hypothetical protein
VSLSRLIWFIGATVGGALGWWLGGFLGSWGTVLLSAVGTALGVWWARRVAAEHF